MRRRVVKNDVLYIDQHLAIVDYRHTGSDITGVIRGLLKVGTKRNDETAPVRNLLERCGFCLARAVSIPDVKVNDFDNPAQIKALGYNLVETSTFLETRFGARRPLVVISESSDAGGLFAGNETMRFCVSLKSINDAAIAVRYTARLALLARGDTRQSDLIDLHEEVYDDAVLDFEAIVPTQIVGDDLEGLSDRAECLRYVTTAKIHEPDANQMVRMRFAVSCYNYYEGDIERFFPRDENRRKRISANVLLSTLLNLTESFPYSPNPESGFPKRNTTANLLTATVDLALEGKLAGCPYCGWPVVRPYPSSDPYCRKSHRTRTDEKKV